MKYNHLDNYHKLSKVTKDYYLETIGITFTNKTNSAISI